MTTDPTIIAQVRTLVANERQKSLSPREWKHRLAGYGYSIQDTDQGTLIKSLPHGEAICTLG